MTIDEKYLHIVLKYIGVMEGEEVESYIEEGKINYMFFCPYCSSGTNPNRRHKLKKTAKLKPTKNNWSYRFSCSKGQSVYCRGSTSVPTSFRNFLSMYNPLLYRHYLKELNQ
jgi:hypothetical protein